MYSNSSTLQDTVRISYHHDSPMALRNSQGTPFSIKYLTGSVTGDIAFESISVGNYMVLQQVFGRRSSYSRLIQSTYPHCLALATDPEDVGLTAVGNSGIMGLAFPRIASIPNRFGQNLISNVLDSMDINSRFFAVHLGRNPGNATLTIGKY
jgi:Eukaryotic aspartyl protease